LIERMVKIEIERKSSGRDRGNVIEREIERRIEGRIEGRIDGGVEGRKE
jgi:hypothetical protein